MAKHTRKWPILSMGLTMLTLCNVCLAQWQEHEVYQYNGVDADWSILPAKFQVVSESWNRKVACPYLVYMPEKDRVLMGIGFCNYPKGPKKWHGMLLSSDNHGTTWTNPRYLHTNKQGEPDTGPIGGLTYIDQGHLLVDTGTSTWYSSDYGQVWSDPVPIRQPRKAAAGMAKNVMWISTQQRVRRLPSGAPDGLRFLTRTPCRLTCATATTVAEPCRQV